MCVVLHSICAQCWVQCVHVSAHQLSEVLCLGVRCVLFCTSFVYNPGCSACRFLHDTCVLCCVCVYLVRCSARHLCTVLGAVCPCFCTPDVCSVVFWVLCVLPALPHWVSTETSFPLLQKKMVTPFPMHRCLTSFQVFKCAGLPYRTCLRLSSQDPTYLPTFSSLEIAPSSSTHRGREAWSSV